MSTGPVGRGRGDLEVGRAVAEAAAHANAVAGDDGQAVEQAGDVRSRSRSPECMPTARARRAAAGRTATLRDLDRLVDRRPGVLAGHAVDLDPRLAAVLLVGGHRLATVVRLPANSTTSADLHAQPGQVGRVEPREAAAESLGKASVTLSFKRRLASQPSPSSVSAGFSSMHSLPGQLDFEHAVAARLRHRLGLEAGRAEALPCGTSCRPVLGGDGQDVVLECRGGHLLRRCRAISATTRTWSDSSKTSTMGSTHLVDRGLARLLVACGRCRTARP